MDPADMPDVPQEPKKKRVPSEKQLAGLSLGLAALKAKREAAKAAKQQPAAPAPVPIAAAAPAPAPTPPAPKGVTWDDLERLKGDLLTSLKPVVAASPAAAPAPEPVKLSGSALLDEIFFRRK